MIEILLFFPNSNIIDNVIDKKDQFKREPNLAMGNLWSLEEYYNKRKSFEK